MNGFFKIVRGTNNLGIESDCHYMVPDISEEELVWEQNPSYGGSLHGIKPFADVKDTELSTDDVVLNHEKTIVAERPAGENLQHPILPQHAEKSNTSWFWTLAMIVGGIILGMVFSKGYYNKKQYSSIL